MTGEIQPASVSGRGGEFRRGWKVVAGAGAGVGLGLAGLLPYNSGLFVQSLESEIGLSRTTYGAAIFGSTLLMALAMPLVARLVDRHGPRAVAAAGAALLGAGFVALSQTTSLLLYLVAMFAIGLLASGSAPVAHTKAVAAAFNRSRGLAFGLTQVGIGISAALVPPLIGAIITEYGWRTGYLVLAGLAVAGLVPVLLALPRKIAATTEPLQIEAAWKALRTRSDFLLQLAAFATMAFAFAGLLSHFVPMLQQSGMSVSQAAAIAGMIGLSVIVTRIIVGALSDFINPAWLGAASCMACAAGCLALAFGGPAYALWGAIALGAAMGAEADLIGIMTIRNFGLAAYSRAYAVQYAVFMVSAGISPLWIGYSADITGTYVFALKLAAALLIMPALLFLILLRRRPAPDT